MTRTRYPRVPVGNGSYCYAGPACKIHSAASAAYHIQKMNEANDESVKTFQRLVKEEGQFVLALEDLGDEALLRGRAAYYSEKDKGFYVYNSSDINVAVVEILRKPLKDFNQAVADGIFPKDQANDTRNKLLAISKTPGYKNLQNVNRKTLIDFQNSFDASEDAIEKRNKQRELARSLSIRQPKVVYDRPVMVPESKIDDATMLEYWRCGRKTKFEDTAAGTKMIQELNETETMSTYTCDYCPKVHIGHGFGKGPEDEALVKARAHWTENAEKANLFAFAKGWLN